MAWETLIGIIQEARDIDAQDASEAPTSCPVDYTTLQGTADGKLYCPWHGLVWPDDASAWGRFPGAF